MFCSELRTSKRVLCTMLSFNSGAAAAVLLLIGGLLAVSHVVRNPPVRQSVQRLVRPMRDRAHSMPMIQTHPSGQVDIAGVDRARLILNEAPRAGFFVGSPQSRLDYGPFDLNFSSTKDTRFSISSAWSVRSGAKYDEWIHAAIDAAASGDEVPGVGRNDVGGNAHVSDTVHVLSGKTLLLFDDSTDGNVWSEICHCAHDTDAKHNIASVVGVTTTQKTQCYTKAMMDASQRFVSCIIPLQGGNLTVHMAGAEHFVHPWGPMPFGRQQTPECDAKDDLASCLRLKLGSASNAFYNLTDIRPDLIVFQSNLWFWFRMQWFGKYDETEWLKRPWDEVMQSYRNNLSVAVGVLRDVYPSARLLSLHTAASAPESAGRIRVANLKISHANAAMRVVAAEQNLPLVDWDIMAHRGWSRNEILADDMHPKVVFNRAVATVYLNALAALPLQSR